MRLGFIHALSIVTLLASTGCTVAPQETDGPEESQESSDEALAPGCPRAARVFTYDPVGWEHLAKAFSENPSPCAQYYIHLPAIAGDKTSPRGPAAVDEIHGYGGQFHALAEFHWGGWAQVTGMTWLQKGKEFRKRMLEKGYDPVRDTWAINELPSSVRKDPAVRQHVRDVVKGLYEGTSGMPKMGGLVFVIGVGSTMENFSVYKPLTEDWLLDSEFWSAMNAHVRWWAQETYPNPSTMCVGGVTVAARAEHLNEFMQHPARLAANGPDGAQAARAFFNESYLGFGSAAWRAESYNTTNISLDNMKRFVSTQVYANRAWSNDHNYPDWRIGLAWNEHPEGATDEQLTELATRTANAIKYAYNNDGTGASRACSPSGAYTYCTCNIAGASFNEGWDTFTHW